MVSPVGAGGDGSVRISTELDTDGVKKGLSGLGGIITKGLGAAVAALAGIGAASIAVGSDFENSFSRIQARTGITGSELDDLQSTFRELGVTSVFSGRQIADAYAQIAVSGHSAADATNIMSAAVTFATATGNDLGASAYMLSNYLMKVGKDSSYAERYINLFSQVTRDSGMSLNDMQNYMFRLTPAFSAMNMSAEAGAGIMNRLYMAGVRGANLYSGMGSILMDVATSGDFTTASMERFGVSAYDANGNLRTSEELLFELAHAMNDYEAATGRSVAGTLGLNQTQEAAWFEFQRLASEIQNEVIPGMYEATSAARGTGIAFEMAAIEADGFHGNLQRMRNIFEDMGIEIYKRLQEPLNEAFRTALAALLPLRESLIDGALSGALDNIAAAVGNLLTFVLQLATAALPHVITALGAFGNVVSTVIGFIVQFGEALVRHIADSGIPDAITRIQEAFGRLVDALPGDAEMGGFIDGLARVVTAILEVAFNVIPLLIDGFTNLVNFLTPIVTPILEAIRDAFDQLGQSSEGLAPIIAALIKAFVGFKAIKAVTATITAFKVALAKIKAVIATVKAVVAGFKTAFAVLKTVFATIKTVVTAVVSAFGYLKKAFAVVKIVVAAVGAAFGVLTAPILAVIAAVAALVAGFILFKNNQEEIIAWLQNAWENIKDFFSNLWEHVKNTFTENWETIRTALTSVWESITAAASSIWNGLKSFFSGLWEGVSSVFSSVWESIKGVLTAIWNAIKATASSVFQGVKDVFSTVWNGVKSVLTGIWETISNVFSTVFGAMVNIAQTIMTQIQTVIDVVWQQIRSTVELVLNVIRGIIEAVMSAIRGDWEGAWNAIKGIFSSVADFLRSTVENIRSVFTSTFNAIREVVTTVFNAIRDVINQIMTGIQNTVSNIMNAIQSTFSSVLSAIQNVVSTAFNAIRSVIDSIMNAVRSTVQSALEGIRSTFTSVLNAILSTVTSIFSNMISAVSNAMNQVLNTVQNIWNQILNFFSSIDLFSVGQRIIQGLVNGIASMAGAALDAARNVANGIKNTISGLFSINSPSRWALDIGQNVGGTLAHSLADSITMGTREIETAVLNLQDNITDALKFDLDDFDIPDLDIPEVYEIKLVFDMEDIELPDTLKTGSLRDFRTTYPLQPTPRNDIIINVTVEHDGDINDEIDIDMLGRRLGERIAEEQRSLGF